MRVLLISSGARGHAIAEALARSRHAPEIISIRPNNNHRLWQWDGKPIASVALEHDIMDFPWILDQAKKQGAIDFAIVADDDPLGAGLVDELENIGIPCAAPKKSLARIEASKSFTRELLEKHRIDASPKFHVFDRNTLISGQPLGETKDLHTYIEQELGGNYVVKYDALKGGKGVKVSGEHLKSVEEGVSYAVECLQECGRVVIEEKLIGVEFSLMSFVSGESVVDMPVIQDHKRAYQGDTGPNTGGMGTYSDSNHSLPFLTEADLNRAREINRLTAKALLKECGEPYKGVLYGGFIATRDGVRLIEYNARFGDPEALNVLPILHSDFVEICQGIIDGSLNDGMVHFDRKATVCKYITPKSYPEKKEEKGKAVTFPVMPENARMYLGDTSVQSDGRIALGGSRSAGIVGIGATLEEAEQIAQEVCASIEGPVTFRSDIGSANLILRRIETMHHLRKKH